MARYTGAVCRQCRRENQKLFLKGDRCYSDKCALARRSFAPGQHGQNQARKKVSEYGLQLRAKQKAKRYYGVLESQFAHYFEIAERKVGMTGENLLRILESRLDNIVYRAGFAMSRKEARQLVLHRHFTVNGEIVNIPSYLVKEGDKIAVRTTDCAKIKECIEKNSHRPVPTWMTKDAENMMATVNKLPERQDIDFDVEETLIVELYSK
ncbi:MAG: 30S ribosomal protein S4 [Oscillospiraceae bacterium]